MMTLVELVFITSVLLTLISGQIILETYHRTLSSHFDAPWWYVWQITFKNINKFNCVEFVLGLTGLIYSSILLVW